MFVRSLEATSSGETEKRMSIYSNRRKTDQFFSFITAFSSKARESRPFLSYHATWRLILVDLLRKKFSSAFTWDNLPLIPYNTAQTDYLLYLCWKPPSHPFFFHFPFLSPIPSFRLSYPLNLDDQDIELAYRVHGIKVFPFLWSQQNWSWGKFKIGTIYKPTAPLLSSVTGPCCEGK